jgi:hypothetical protein
MDSFIINKFAGGISDYEDRGISGAFKYGQNLDVRKRRDSLTCNQAIADDLAHGTFTSRARFIVGASDGNTYFFTNDKIYKRTSGGTYTLEFTDVDGGINGAAEWVNNVGDTFIYWATATKLHRKRIIGTGYTNTGWGDADATVNGQTYPKTNLTSAAWHTMKQVNGVLMIANSNTIAQVGYDDSYTNNTLQLIPSNIAKTLVESGTNLRVGANRIDTALSSNIFLWDGISQNWNDKMQLPFSNINAMIESEVGIMQYGTEGGLYFYSDSSKLPITRFPSGGQCDPDGVETSDGIAYFGVYGNGNKSGIYSYGRKWKNADFILTCEYQFTCDEINAVKKIGNTLFFTYKFGSNYAVKKIDLSNKGIGNYQSLDLKAPVSYQTPVNFESAVINLTPLPSGTNIEVWRRIDKIETATAGTGVTADGWYRCNTVDGSTNFSTTGGTEAVFLIGDKGKIIELQIILNPTGNTSPEVLNAQVMFSK